MRTVVASVSLGLLVVLVSFFLVFSFHASTDTQKGVKQFLDSGEGNLPFADAANSHMHDVFSLLVVARILAAVCVLLVAKYWRDLGQTSLVWTGSVLVLAPLVLALMPWDKVFTVFHQVFFPQGNWMFSYSSLIIQTYPASFFMVFAAVWAALIMVSGVTLVLVRRRFA